MRTTMTDTAWHSPTEQPTLLHPSNSVTAMPPKKSPQRRALLASITVGLLFGEFGLPLQLAI